MGRSLTFGRDCTHITAPACALLRHSRIICRKLSLFWRIPPQFSGTARIPKRFHCRTQDWRWWSRRRFIKHWVFSSSVVGITSPRQSEMRKVLPYQFHWLLFCFELSQERFSEAIEERWWWLVGFSLVLLKLQELRWTYISSMIIYRIFVEIISIESRKYNENLRWFTIMPVKTTPKIKKYTYP